jgi:hypothetical protein
MNDDLQLEKIIAFEYQTTACYKETTETSIFKNILSKQ